MMYIPDGDRLLVIASNIGAPTHPDWYRNLVAHPTVTVEFKSEIFDATAIVMEGAERERLWNKVVQQYTLFRLSTRRRLQRQIPLIALERKTD